MRLIIDCNILVSAGLQSKNCLRVIKYATTKAELFISDDIVNEYQEVIKRKKFIKYHQYMENILTSVIMASSLEISVPSSSICLPDIFDVPYIDLAMAVKADFLITGNLVDFPDTPYGKTTVISPADFLRKVLHI